MGLRSDLLHVVLGDLPASDSVLTEPDPRWDQRLGGRTGKDSWTQYGRAAGTTCLVVGNNWLRAAGAPAEMVVSTPTPMGGGTKMIQAQIAYAKAMGWLHTPTRGQLPDLQPGDIVNLNHDARDKVTGAVIDGTHEGVVVRVNPRADGTLEVETADGGQGTRPAQKATRQVRIFSLGDGAHPVHVRSPSTGGDGWLDRWIALPDDGPSDAPDEEDDAEEGVPPAIVALGVAGAALALGAVAWWAYERHVTRSSGHMNALGPRSDVYRRYDSDFCAPTPSEIAADTLAAFDLDETQMCQHLKSRTAQRLGLDDPHTPGRAGLATMTARRELRRRAHDAEHGQRFRLTPRYHNPPRIGLLPYK